MPTKGLIADTLLTRLAQVAELERQQRLDREKREQLLAAKKEREEKIRRDLALSGLDPSLAHNPSALYRAVIQQQQAEGDIVQERERATQRIEAAGELIGAPTGDPLQNALAGLRQVQTTPEAVQAGAQAGIVRAKRAETIRTEQRGEQATIRTEERGEARTTRKQEIEDAAQTIALYHLGLKPPTDQVRTREQVILDLVETYGSKAAVRAMNQSDALVAKEMLRQQGAEGKTFEKERVEAFEALANKQELTPRQKGVMLASGNAFTYRDEIVVTGAGQAANDKIRERLAAIDGLNARMPLLIRDYLEVVSLGPEANVGSILGLENFVELQSAFGVINPAVASYMVNMRRMASLMLKSDQGSRPSDYDLRLFMALMPRLTEVNNPEIARRKFNALREGLEISRQATLGNSQAARQVAELRAPKWNEQERELKRLALAWRDAKTEKEATAKFVKFQAAVDEWNTTGRGQQFNPLPANETAEQENARQDQLNSEIERFQQANP